MSTATAEITKQDLDPKDIAYANIFFPDGMNQKLSDADSTKIMQAIKYNRTFGPIGKDEYCLDEITKYEFFVFNRWGQKVFESTSVSNEWDGQFKDEKAPTETYLWVVKYTIFGTEKVQKGSITLVRL